MKSELPPALWTWAWTPPDCDELAAIGLRFPPSQAMTRQQYRFALIDKIDKMVARTEPSKLSFLARSIYSHEGLDVIDRPALLGEVLIENSDAIAAHCSFGFENIPLDRLIHEPRTLRRLTQRPMSLASFLARLYD